MISQKEIHQTAVAHKFWEDPINIPEKLCLIHSEVSEAMEIVRNEGCIEAVGEELADIVIRVMDLAEHLGLDLEYEITLKHAFNKTRPVKHGKKF